jgi:hypothetical protein
MSSALGVPPAAPQQIQPVPAPGVGGNMAQPAIVDPNAPVEPIPGDLVPLPPGQVPFDPFAPPEADPQEPGPQPGPLGRDPAVRPQPQRPQPPQLREPEPEPFIPEPEPEPVPEGEE